jgi:hypothetical protein
MSVFGEMMTRANTALDNTFGDVMTYVPMKARINATPIEDLTRPGGSVKAVLVKPGEILGSGWSLQQMHSRASSDIRIYYMAEGILANVQKADRFVLPDGPNYPHGAGRYEVSDGPEQYGFGRYYVKVFEIPINDLVEEVA